MWNGRVVVLELYYCDLGSIIAMFCIWQRLLFEIPFGFQFYSVFVPVIFLDFGDSGCRFPISLQFVPD